MTYIKNGKYRAKEAVLNYLDGDGQQLPNYPKTYDFLQSFQFNGTTHPPIDELELATMSESEYNSRLAAFYGYIESQNPNLDAQAALESGYEPTGTSPLCSIGTVVDDPGSGAITD